MLHAPKGCILVVCAFRERASPNHSSDLLELLALELPVQKHGLSEQVRVCKHGNLPLAVRSVVDDPMRDEHVETPFYSTDVAIELPRQLTYRLYLVPGRTRDRTIYVHTHVYVWYGVEDANDH